MCAVSVINDYGRNMPDSDWNPEALTIFQEMVDKARKFDELTKQPNCEDPEKLKWVEAVKSKVE